MCDLCESDPELREKAKKAHLARAEELEKLALAYKQLAYGIFKPHTNDAKAIGAVARHVVRFLVEEWV